LIRDGVEPGPTGVEVVQKALEIDDGGFGVGIKIAEERGLLGDGVMQRENGGQRNDDERSKP